MMSLTSAPRLVFASMRVFWPIEGFGELGVGFTGDGARFRCRESFGAVGFATVGAGVGVGVGAGAGLLGKRSSMIFTTSARSGAAPARLRVSAAAGFEAVVVAVTVAGAFGLAWKRKIRNSGTA